MNSRMDEFFKQEKSRVFEPDTYFPQRVMARVAARLQEQRENGIWEGMKAGSRPVFALALVLLLAFLAVQLFVPVLPPRGPIEAFLSTDQSPDEQLIYTGVDPSSPELEQMIIITEDGQ